MTTTVSLIGSTGSIGAQAVQVALAEPGAYRVVALAAMSSITTLAEQARMLEPDLVVVGDETKAHQLAELLCRDLPGVEVATGPDALAAASGLGEVVVNAVVGFSGLPVTLAALRAGRRLALANKESLVAGGPVVRDALGPPGGEIIPVDSEHSAIHQCLRSSVSPSVEVKRLVLTASGGPFRGRSEDELQHVGVADALAHPTWSMGPKNTVDSSTLANKGLEVIEAHELFGTGYSSIEVVVHPQSVVHSMVEFGDGATIAQLSLPDMRLAIGYALSYPRRFPVPFGRIDWADLSRLDFEQPDHASFPCLSLAIAAGEAGGSAPAWFNAANEVAVAAFLEGALPWRRIAGVIEHALDRCGPERLTCVEDVLEADRAAREAATAEVLRELTPA